MTCDTACSPCTLLSRVRTFTVVLLRSFSPTTAAEHVEYKCQQRVGVKTTAAEHVEYKCQQRVGVKTTAAEHVEYMCQSTEGRSEDNCSRTC